MKKFVHKTIGFITFFCLLLFLTVFLNKYFSNFKIENNKHMLVIGHSHSECAYNDSLINGLINYSQSGDSYFYTYFKTKLLKDNNPQIDKVFIEFSNNQIEKHMDEWIWDDNFMLSKFPKYALFMDRVALNLLIENNPDCFKQSIVSVFKNNIKMLFKGLKYTNEIGGYRHLIRDKTDSLVANLALNNDPIDESQELSQNNIEYLQKIIKYCEQKEIKVFFIRSPLHKKYSENQNENLFQEILTNQFATVEFLDFSKFPLTNSQFGDLQHLNYKGAKIFSDWFAGLLNKGLLEKENKQTWIDDAINSRTIN